MLESISVVWVLKLSEATPHCVELTLTQERNRRNFKGIAFVDWHYNALLLQEFL